MDFKIYAIFCLEYLFRFCQKLSGSEDNIVMKAFRAYSHNLTLQGMFSNCPESPKKVWAKSMTRSTISYCTDNQPLDLSMKENSTPLTKEKKKKKKSIKNIPKRSSKNLFNWCFLQKSIKSVCHERPPIRPTRRVLRKLRPELDVQTQLDYLHGGMLPDLQKIVCRKYLRSVDDLMQEALEAENTMKKADQYRAPTSDETTLPELRYSPGKREETSYRILSLSNPNDEVSTLMQAQIETTQRLSGSVKEVQSRLTSLEERFCEKKQTELLQKISESITESQNHNCNLSGKPDGQKHQEKRKSTQQRKNVSSTQQAGMQPSSPAENKMKKTLEIRCYGCGVPNVYRKNCTTCSENGAIGKAAGNLKKDLEGHWWMQVQVGGKELSGLYDTGENCTTMTEIAAQFAQKCGRTITSVHSRRTRCANDSASVVTGFVDLPFTIGVITRDVRVDIIPDLWTNCLLGSNFTKTSQTIHNTITNECIVGLNEASVPMDFEADQSKISAIGLVEMTQREGKRSRVHLNEASFTGKKDASMCDCSEVKHLRARVNYDRMKLDRSRIKEILNFSIPTSAKQLRRFLGMCSWYRKLSKD
ncbi:unnamed protein product [Trichogramma brassicae]|uniref:Uncharacterized protein n=1 Tax=Trichogramma brassicae TaxID=86971 RepID=A0A6H5I2H1_9HYME|nr:unnamed protein product [Trichogramma brassicae]